MTSVNCLHTGGSVGGDSYFEDIAKKNNHLIKLYHFDGHKNTRIEVINNDRGVTNNHYEPLEITAAEMKICGESLELASKKLGRHLPETGYQRHLLERDYFLVNRSGATSFYSIGHWIDRTTGIIEGGTGFISELFLIRHPTYPMYFHCIESGLNYKMTLGGWMPIDSFPSPHGQWIGVGSRAFRN